ncbi:MAG: right-handed parallel beta-helix repeat-containing protein [Euryarchaeota archaeon]|nr:right-handed parallel beta-helix repeat-containing protein [Euryarchaeota archaeon]
MHRSSALGVGFLLLFSFVVLTVPASAASLTVGPSEQYKTITEAVNAAQPGDTITIGPGTYTENVIVAKSLTITALRADSPPTIKAADQNKDVFRVQGRDVHIAGLTITGASNASGVHIDHTSGCVVTTILSYSNERAVYLEGATNSEVRDSNLAGNGYGVYCDGASHNIISGNVATNERGTKDALGDGLYLFYSNGNTITDNNCSANHIFGISLFKSSDNTISKNVIRSNEQIGVRLRDSDNNTLTYNTISSNGQPGKELDYPPAAPSFGQLGILLASNNTRVYLNDFVNQSIPVSDGQSALWSSPEKLTYTYNDVTHQGYMGNHYSDYEGSDISGTGIGSTPSAYGDTYPLIRPFESYEPIGTHSLATLPARATTSPAQDTPSSVAAVSVVTGLPMERLVSGMLGFSIGTALIAIIVIAYVVMHSRSKPD